jgi:hypothetical protein
MFLEDQTICAATVYRTRQQPELQNKAGPPCYAIGPPRVMGPLTPVVGSHSQTQASLTRLP